MKFSIIILAIFFTCCREIDASNFIENKTVINNDSVKRMEINRGVLNMTNLGVDYKTVSWCPLIYKDTFPRWIEDKGKSDYSFRKYKFEPSISDIDVPYVIFKRKGENFFSIIKNRDTLKFKIVKL